MTLQTRSTWLVSSERATYDLDNILLQKLPDYESALEADFVLNNLLLEASVSDFSQQGQPPRGLELILGNSSNPHVEVIFFRM